MIFGRRVCRSVYTPRNKPEAKQKMIAALIAAASVAHVPGFSQSTVHTFRNTVLSQVEYRGPGRHVFRFTCSNKPLYWEVVAPGQSSATVSVSSSLTSSDYSETSTSGCFIKRYREGWTMTDVGTVAMYGRKTCASGKQEVIVESGGPTAFVIGEKEKLSDMEMWKMPIYYVRVGAWAGVNVPWVFAFVVVAAVFLWSKNVHVTLAAVWIVFIWTDLARFLVAVDTPTDSTCSANPSGASGSKHHSDDDGTGMIVGLYIVRFILGVGGLLLLYAHTKTKAWWVAAVAGVFAIAGYFFAVGLGIWGLLLFVYYCVETRRSDSYPRVFFVDRGSNISYAMMNTTLFG